MLGEQQRRLVSPVHIVDHQHEREPLGAAGDEVGDSVEEVAALLLGGDVERLGNVRKAPAQLRHHARHFGRGVAHVFHDHVGGHHRQRLFEHLYERRVRNRALGLVAAPEQHASAMLDRLGDQLADDGGLADAGLAAHEHHASPPVEGVGQAVAQHAQLRVTADKRWRLR